MCSVIGAVLGAAGSFMSGKASRDAANAEAAAAEANAKIADAQAVDAIKRGGYEELKERRQMQILQGQQRAAAAANGVNVDTGSAADIQNASMDEAERDISAGGLNAAREAWSFDVQATNYRNSAAVARAAGKNAMLGGIMGAGASLLSLATPSTGSGRKISAGKGGMGPRYGDPQKKISWQISKAKLKSQGVM